MTDIEIDRRRTRPEDDDSEDEEEPQPDSGDDKRQFRSRIEDYATEAEWPQYALYEPGEVVYIAFPGQQRPAGPYVIISSNVENGTTYKVQRQDTGQNHPTAVPESLIRVLV